MESALKVAISLWITGIIVSVIRDMSTDIRDRIAFHIFAIFTIYGAILITVLTIAFIIGLIAG